MIEVEQMKFTYPGASSATLDGMAFTIDDGEVFGFLGPSGAGKSTTQKILIGLLEGYEGSARVMGKEVSAWGQEYYEQIGVSFELPNHFLKLTARENLAYFGSLYAGPVLTPDEVLEWVGLAPDADKLVSEFSKGMKIRLNVARSLLHRPKLLFLDEPTSGLDPVNARKIKDLILEVRARGATVFVTTHNMSVADELCDRVAFVTDGAIRLIDSPAALKKTYGTRRVEVEFFEDGHDEVRARDFALDGLGEDGAFLELLQGARRLETIHTQETTLERIFIEVTGEELTR